ncbi:MAG: hypothetical protein RMM98_17705, partial [Acidobacteriota bacterium]|nr:hypothetical protein [Acidobacteriota bacterium]
LAEALRANPVVVRQSRLLIKPKLGKVRRYTIAHLSDNHWGGYIDPREVELNNYSWQIAARRTGKFAHEVAHYKLDHRDECGGLVLNIGGDQLEGILGHDQDWSNVDMLTWQLVGATRYLVAFIDYQLNFYKRVIVPITADNHGRVQTPVKGRKRATQQRYDSFITVMMHGVAQAFRHERRVQFIQPLTPYTLYRLFSWNYLLVHGDAVLDFGNPHRAIQLQHIANQINQFNATREAGERVHVVFGGHVHYGLNAWLPNGVHLFINPVAILFEASPVFRLCPFSALYFQQLASLQ